VIREVKTRAKGNNRKRPSLAQRRNENGREKRRIDRCASLCTVKFQLQRNCLTKTSKAVRSAPPKSDSREGFPSRRSPHHHGMRVRRGRLRLVCPRWAGNASWTLAAGCPEGRSLGQLVEFLAEADQHPGLGLVDGVEGHAQFFGDVGRGSFLDGHEPERLPGLLLELGADQFQGPMR